MGIGKIVIQAFLQFRNLDFVYGVELSIGRYLMAEESGMLCFCSLSAFFSSQFCLMSSLSLISFENDIIIWDG